ncbi:MAG: hypothetical protein ABIF01_01960, partial [Candidatus Micrarchaeota archaeon]
DEVYLKKEGDKYYEVRQSEATHKLVIDLVGNDIVGYGTSERIVPLYQNGDATPVEKTTKAVQKSDGAYQARPENYYPQTDVCV